MRHGKPERGTTVKLRGVHKVTAKGRTYFYAYRGGPKLSGDPSEDPAVAAEYFRHMRITPPPVRSTLVAPLVLQYQASPKFGGRSAKWTATKRGLDDLIVSEFGEDDIAIFDDARTRRDIIEWRDRMAETPRKADQAVNELACFLGWARDNGYLVHNCATGIKKLSEADRAAIVWEPGEIEAVCLKANGETANVIRLASLTGLARIDLLRLRWSDVKDNHIGPLDRSKTGQLIVIPLYQELRDALEACPQRSPIVLTNSAGRPWTADGFTCGFQKAKTAAGIDKRFHDLRGTAVTMLYRLGLSDEEVAEIVGWSVQTCRAIRRRYVTPQAVAEGLIVRLDRNGKRTKL